MRRKNFSRAVEAEVLTRCRRLCALCFIFEDDIRVKRGQLVHIDRNKANAARENAAFLELHHDEYDSVSRQTKRIMPAELKEHQKSLLQYLDSPEAWQKKSRVKATGISLELYDRRLPIYRMAMQFFRLVQADYKPDLQEILKFARDTDEALFLFDETIAEYLTELFKKALRLRAITLNLERKGWSEPLWQKGDNLVTWFSEQSEEIRRRFAPYLRPIP